MLCKQEPTMMRIAQLGTFGFENLEIHTGKQERQQANGCCLDNREREYMVHDLLPEKQAVLNLGRSTDRLNEVNEERY